MTTTNITSPLSGWMGGKFLLSKQIIKRIPEHRCYVEPFAGAAWVFFRKDPSKVEVLNDINKEIVTLYRVVQHHPKEFQRQLESVFPSRDEFQRQLKTPPDTLTDIQRAVRFFYILKNAYAGRVDNSPAFKVAVSKPPNLNPGKFRLDLKKIHTRLSRVGLENLPYQKLIPRYDRADTFFYLDPPYFGCEDYYGKDIFSRSDFKTLAALLMSLKGHFLLSLNDTPEVRETFRLFKFEEVQTRYSCAARKSKKVTEVLISNY